MKRNLKIASLVLISLFLLPAFTSGPFEKTITTKSELDSLIENSELSLIEPLILRPEIPAEQYYSDFNPELIFPQFALSDIDSVTDLVLDGSFQGSYFHPICGSVNSPYGIRHGRPHKGIDLALKTGDPVYSAFDGKVRIAKVQGGFGKAVVIRHYNGLETIYGHLSKICVEEGQIVTAGEIIGKGGSTGNSTGPHLHFELRFKGYSIDPSSIISFESGNLITDTLRIKKVKKGLVGFPRSQTTYTTQKGDDWRKVAEKFGMNTKELFALNKIQKWTYLKKGTHLQIQ